MSALLADTHEDILLETAIREARAAGLPFAGSVPPIEAWALVESGRAVLVDVRSSEERKFVGYVVDSVHVPWATGTALTRNPRFLRELEAKVGKDDVILLLCRSGKRSAHGGRGRGEASASPQVVQRAPKASRATLTKRPPARYAWAAGACAA